MRCGACRCAVGAAPPTPTGPRCGCTTATGGRPPLRERRPGRRPPLFRLSMGTVTAFLQLPVQAHPDRQQLQRRGRRYGCRRTRGAAQPRRASSVCLSRKVRSSEAMHCSDTSHSSNLRWAVTDLEEKTQRTVPDAASPVHRPPPAHGGDLLVGPAHRPCPLRASLRPLRTEHSYRPFPSQYAPRPQSPALMAPSRTAGRYDQLTKPVPRSTDRSRS